MNITVKRQTSNRLYTEGLLLVNGLRTAHTVESTAHMLPAGEYVIRLTKDKNRRRVIGIFRSTHFAGWSIGIGHSWIGSSKHRVIAIGDVLIPGAVYKATETYERIFDRIEKCEDRHEPITLVIDESQCIGNKPIKHWTSVTVTRNYGYTKNP